MLSNPVPVLIWQVCLA